jgi:ParB family chromosome partitioning protein
MVYSECAWRNEEKEVKSVGIFSHKNQGLGRLDEHKTVGRVILLATDEVAPNPAQPRQEFDLEALQGLSDSIRLNGVLQPILVRRTDPDKSDKPYELISGERRLRASMLCGNETIPAVVMDSTARQSAVYAILENIQRKDLNLFEEAAALRTLVVEWGVTQEEAAAKLGMAQPTIANKMRLLALSQTEQQIILENRLTERHGRALLRLPSGPNREKVAGLIGERHLNVRETEELIGRLLMGETELSEKQQEPVPSPPAEVIAVPEAPPPKKEHRRARKVLLVKDVRVFLNTVNQAIDAMKHAGIPAETRQEDHGEYIEYLVRIPTGKVQRTKSAGR